MSNIRPFQIFLLGGFVLMAFFALFLLTTNKPGGTDDINPYGSDVLIWGTLDPSAFDAVSAAVAETDKNFRVVTYKQIPERNFEGTLINAIAEGRSPDLIVLPHDQLVRLRSKLAPISYERITQRQFRDSYVDGAEIFARPNGIYAIPFAVDPLVMYWNRDLFASNGLAQAPTTWESVTASVVPVLTVRDANRTIIRSALAFGEYRNVRNAKEVLSLLLLQSGSRMVEESDKGYVVALDEAVSDNSRPPMEAAVQFYTDFSNANSPSYTWNRAQAEDRDSFVSGDLAMYFGFGSEVSVISDRNPNLNFDVAPVPQGAGANVRRNYGQFYGFAVPLAARNPGGAYSAAIKLTNPAYNQVLVDELSLAPVNRSALAKGSNSALQQIIYEAALFSRGWLDPNPTETTDILRSMIEDVVSSRARVSAAVSDAVNRITLNF